MFAAFKRWLRRDNADRPFPEDYRAIVTKNVAMADRLGPEDRKELERLVLTFLDEKTFEGGGGFEITDEVKVTIATQACILLLHRDTDVYPDLETVLVYPSAYVSKATRRDGMVVIEGDEARLGESWSRGIVVLAWDAVRSGTANVDDGKNVVLHEFAHQLDGEDGSMDGAPELGSRDRYKTWARVLGSEFEELALGGNRDIDAYGATNPPEFFAVITEAFFEKPIQLKNKHPELYETLVAFYKQDPATFLPAKRASRKERRKKK